MIIYHGTSKEALKKILSKNWDANNCYCSNNKDYAAGYARASSIINNKAGNPVILTIETDNGNLRITGLTFTCGEVVIKSTEQIKIMEIEMLE